MQRSTNPAFPRLAALLASGLLACTAHAATAVREIKTSPAPIFDFEFDFDASRARFVWMGTDTREVWVGYVNRATGEFSPVTGKAELVDSTGSAFPGNGPEWVETETGPRIVYTKLKNQQGTIVTRLAQAQFDGAAWQWEGLPYSVLRVNPLGSPVMADGVAPVLYFSTGQPDTQILWRPIDRPRSEKLVPQSLGATGARWVAGTLQMVFTAPVADGRQVFLYDGATGVSQQLTFDGPRKQTVFMFEAPEFPGEKVMFVSMKGTEQSEMRVYRYLDRDQDGRFEWTAIKRILPQVPGHYFWSPEPLVHNGKSYVFWVSSTQPDQPDPAYPSEMWLASLDPADPFYVTLSDPALVRFRVDPEVFVTDLGPVIYYNRYVPGTPQTYEGVYRVDTGLGPVVTGR